MCWDVTNFQQGNTLLQNLVSFTNRKFGKLMKCEEREIESEREGERMEKL